MKTKNLICGIVGTLATISVASASEDECMQRQGMVWNSKDQVCISATPCEDSEYDEYCNRIFKNVQLQNGEDAKKLIDLYLSKQDLSCTEIDMDEAHLVGQDRIRCHLSDGSYTEFEFDDYSESTDSTGDFGFAKGVCLIYGGEPDGMTREEASGLIAMGAMASLSAGVLALTGDIPFGVIAGANAITLLNKGLKTIANDVFLVCNGVSEEYCEEMYDGCAAYVEEERKCLPRSDFSY